MSLGLGNGLLSKRPKPQWTKEKKKRENWISPKLRTFVLKSTPSKERKVNPLWSWGKNDMSRQAYQF